MNRLQDLTSRLIGEDTVSTRGNAARMGEPADRLVGALRRPVVFLFTSDEEIGCSARHTSRPSCFAAAGIASLICGPGDPD